MIDIFLTGVLLIFTGGIISLFVKEKIKAIVVSFFVFCGAIFTLIPSFTVIIKQKVISEIYTFNFPVGELKIVIDPLAAFFIILISIMSFVSAVYSIGYLKPYLKTKRTISSHFLFLSMLIASMILVVSIQNALAFLIAWEIMSISSFFLVVFENEKNEVFDAGINYLITMHISVVFLIIGFILLSISSGSSLDFESFKSFLNNNKNFANIIFIIFFIGFGIKAGFIPLHTWLPKAHPASPSNVSGMMSGLMIKIGIYGILRILLLIGNPGISLSYFVLCISLISGVFGVMYAITQHDYKKLLAYHSVENIGIIGIGIGLGMLGIAYKNNFMSVLGFFGAFLHILNHSIFKMLLFYSSGAVYQKTHTRNIDDLGGLIKTMRFTAVFFLIGTLSITGVPPFNGFISEFLIYLSMINGISTNNLVLSVIIILSIALLAFIGCMALLCFTKVFGMVFLGNARTPDAEKASEVSPSMIIPMAVLSLFCILIGLFPAGIVMFIKPVVSLFGVESTFVFSNTVNLLTNISKNLFIFILIFFALFFIRYLLLRKKRIYKTKTWDCGYQAYNPRMQYTSSSFSKSFLFLVNPLINKQYKIKKPEGLFPVEASFDSHTKDLFEKYLINPFIKLVRKFLDLFTWIQSGDTQKYILYGLIFLVFVILSIIIFNLFKIG